MTTTPSFYANFDFCIRCSPEELDWFVDEIEVNPKELFAGEGGEELPGAEEWMAERAVEELENWPPFSWDYGEDSFTFIGDEDSNLGAALALLHLFVAKFRPDGGIGVEWVNVPGPCVEGPKFSGGAAWITADGVEYYDAEKWVFTKKVEFLEKTRVIDVPASVVAGGTELRECIRGTYKLAALSDEPMVVESMRTCLKALENMAGPGGRIRISLDWAIREPVGVATCPLGEVRLHPVLLWSAERRQPNDPSVAGWSSMSGGLALYGAGDCGGDFLRPVNIAPESYAHWRLHS